MNINTQLLALLMVYMLPPFIWPLAFMVFMFWVGTIFLTVCLFRGLKGHFTAEHHFGFEAAAWYWHFVDVVWLFLFVCIYWWGG